MQPPTILHRWSMQSLAHLTAAARCRLHLVASPYAVDPAVDERVVQGIVLVGNDFDGLLGRNARYHCGYRKRLQAGVATTAKKYINRIGNVRDHYP
jgi:hypothetical protein